MSVYLQKAWPVITALLIISLITGVTVFVIKLNAHRPMEISLQPSPVSRLDGNIYISGAVANPGYYTTRSDDTVMSLIEAAGPSPDGDLGSVKIYVPKTSQNGQPQKININRAEAWLLEALPGIGAGRAKAIISYRQKNGPYRNINELLQIEGFGNSTLDKIKGFISVDD